ncbi:FAD-binding oxidoreductase [Streptomyces sp. LX-29]|uniref:globin domain-containing protein n=1 Tax=Streptomyces sp. LX-29 TaxID=2900152 RepID=UPI00240D2CC7|nr:globin domain-containing protein [Streptomyces sp. LX-29]WFB08435.1 FAD-binding oxidoreductase [Streptomyces sp. LX-29]
MDAPTTTSSDGDDSGGNSGDWGWFTPSRGSGKGAEHAELVEPTPYPANTAYGERAEHTGRLEHTRLAEHPDPAGAAARTPDAPLAADPPRPGPGGRAWSPEGRAPHPSGRSVSPAVPAGGAPERRTEPAAGPAPAQWERVSGPAPAVPATALHRTAAAAPASVPYRAPAAPSPASTPAPTPPAPARIEHQRSAESVPGPAATRPGAGPAPAPARTQPPRRDATPAPGTGVSGPLPAGEPTARAGAMSPTAPALSAPAPTTPAPAPSTPSTPPGPMPAAVPPLPGPMPPAAPPLPAAASPRGTAAPSPDAILIRRTMAELEPIADKATSYFYALLFLRNPGVRDLFPAAMDAQRDRLFKALLTAAKHVDDTDILTEYLTNLGRGHRKYGTLAEHYPAVGECLIDALIRYAPESWDAATEAAWVRAYTAISQIMIDAAAEDELRAPAWWNAEVVAHERRTSDIAVITLRPDQPYPFLAGQYASLETPWWPRVWRHYSFAAAPRPDGLLAFHVKAVPAGWVSTALVHRARLGDVIRLGPPAGSMTVDHSTDNGLLCLGGGTGIAPIKALVEDVAEHGRQRPVEVFYGARSDQDLYDIDTMLRLAESHPWLAVRPVVADGPTNGISGRLPDAVRQYGPWNSYDAYLSGPPGMIRSGVHALQGIGIPSHRIRHDSVEELVAAGS